MDYKNLGLRIRKQRKSLHLTQEDLAQKVGISLSFLGHIERGSRKASVETLVGLANAMGMSLDTMLQDSLSENVLKQRPENDQHRLVLEELSRIINQNLENWKK